METLATLAERIRLAHGNATTASYYSAEQALEAGRWLMAARDRDGDDAVPQGGWDRWVEEEAGVPKQSANIYMRLFRANEERRLTLDDIAEHGQIGALKLAAAAESEERREASRSAPELVDGMDLRIGDARIVLADIADNSVPLILTDPPYGDEAEPLYEWLAMWAERVLIPGGSLICYNGTARHDRDIAIFRERPGLKFWWLCQMPHTQAQRLPGKFVMATFKPVLWYVKGFRRGRTLMSDTFVSPARDKLVHEWAQGEGGVWVPIEHLTEPGELIVDPFAGTATWGRTAAKMGRRWIGADIEWGGTTTVLTDSPLTVRDHLSDQAPQIEGNKPLE
jgi:hypothetical protein